MGKIMPLFAALLAASNARGTNFKLVRHLQKEMMVRTTQ